MSALLAILWFIWLIAAFVLLTEAGRIAAIVAIFPESRRWWTAPLQYGAYAFFALCILLNPWSCQ